MFSMAERFQFQLDQHVALQNAMVEDQVDKPV